jgi:hypothetical protein
MFRAVHDTQSLLEKESKPMLPVPASMSSVASAATSASNDMRSPVPVPVASPDIALGNYQSSPPRQQRQRARTPSSTSELSAVESSLKQESMFSVVVDENKGRKTIAAWQTSQPQDIIELLAKVRRQARDSSDVLTGATHSSPMSKN